MTFITSHHISYLISILWIVVSLLKRSPRFHTYQGSPYSSLEKSPNPCRALTFVIVWRISREATRKLLCGYCWTQLQAHGCQQALLWLHTDDFVLHRQVNIAFKLRFWCMFLQRLHSSSVADVGNKQIFILAVLAKQLTGYVTNIEHEVNTSLLWQVFVVTRRGASVKHSSGSLTLNAKRARWMGTVQPDSLINRLQLRKFSHQNDNNLN